MVNEGEDVRFECQVSHDEAPLVQWKLQDVPLQDNEMNVIKSEGRLHSLTLRGVTEADSGTVTFTVGNHTSTASLTVKGKTPVMGQIFQGLDQTLSSFLSNTWMALAISSIFINIHIHVCMCVYICPICVALGSSNAIVGFYPAFHINMFYPTIMFTEISQFI